MRKLLFLLLILLSITAFSQPIDQKLKGFDKQMEAILRDWNVPGCGVGIVMKNKLVYAKGFGYRNIEQKQPVTPNTLFQIASNTKLFTATAVGFLVEEGKLEWDKPVKTFVPEIQFYNDELNAHVTLRDMLSHRTGISRHDNIWYKSDFTRQELFDRVKYLEPSLPLRQGYLYNNLMYAAAGHIVEKVSGQTWEKFVDARIFKPLGMNHSMFVTEDMQKQPDFMTPYIEKRDTNLLVPFPFYTKQQGVGPCGSIISSINDLSHWVIAQLYKGKFEGKQVIPANVIKETMQPASITAGIPDKYFESLNSLYGMGRGSVSYKGHYRVSHGGAIGGIYSNVSIMPADSIGVIVFTNGAHYSGLPTIVANIVYDRLLSLPETPWSERNLKSYNEGKAADKAARKKPDVDRVAGTKPSHVPTDYAGSYEDPAYGVMTIKESGGNLSFTYNNTTLPLSHYHYDRFVSPDDQIDGKWSLQFSLDARGDVKDVRVSLDENEVVFVRKPDAELTQPEFLRKLAGRYELNGDRFEIVLQSKELVISSAPPQHLVPMRSRRFSIREFPDQSVQFQLDASGNVLSAAWTFDGKTLTFVRAR